ncbi:hypothetical protein D3C85_1024640 [compost metagenome]
MPGVVVVEVTVGQYQQLVEQLHTQVMHQAQRDLGQEIVAQIRTYSLPQRDQHDQQRYRLQQLQVGEEGDLRQVRDTGKEAGLGIRQAVDEILEDVTQHGLGRGENQEAKNTEQEEPDIRPDIAQQSQINAKIRLPVRIGHSRSLYFR